MFTIIMASVCLDAKQKHLGCKKVRGQSEATLHRHVQPTTLISAEAKKLLYQNYYQNYFQLLV